MRIRTQIISLAVAALALALPSVAAAKGPSKASIMGPGLSAPVAIDGEEGAEGSNALGLLVSQTGFFPQTFGQSPDPLLREQPAARKLGARYTVTYTVPGPSTSIVQQDLYPYAAGGAISYMEPGQQIWSQQTHGGWYRAGSLSSELREMLANVGLPKTAPAVVRNRNASHLKEMRVALGTGAGVVLAAGALIFLRRRR
jgi:hypothetical protein